MTTLATHLAEGMRTPLTCILGYLELLLDDPAGALSDEQRHHLDAIARSARALQRLAARVEVAAEGELPLPGLTRTRVDLVALVERVYGQPHVHVGPLVPVRCSGDHEALAQLLDTLVAAAREHAAGGTTTVSLRRVGARAVIRVRGTCADQTASTSGQDLGLAVARGIATAHEGRLTAVIGPPGTLTLRCELPAEPAE
jgi:signal transduction histidine kinase